MSQIYKSLISGPVPPAVPTSFKTDVQDNFLFSAGSGTSVPIANVEQIYGDNGIQTSANTVTNNVIQIRFNSANVNTVSNETVTAMLFPTINNSTFSTQVLVAGFCATQSQGVGGSTVATVVNVAGVATLVDEPDYDVNTGAALTDATFSVTAVGANLVISVTGSLGNPITWAVCTPGQVQT